MLLQHMTKQLTCPLFRGAPHISKHTYVCMYVYICMHYALCLLLAIMYLVESLDFGVLMPFCQVLFGFKQF